MKIDISSWKNFKFSEVFEIRKGFYNKKPESSGNGSIPFIGATDSNNGITEYYTIEEIENTSKTGDGMNEPLEKKIFPANAVCVTNNGSVGYAYFQEHEFTCSHDVNPLYPLDRKFNRYTGLFIASIIMKDRYRWGYGRKWRPERMAQSKILLPVNSHGSPDWNYMEDFVRKLYCKPLTTKIKKSNKSELVSDNWKEFYLHKIFKIAMGNGLDVNKTTSFAPKYNYVSRNSNNNGVVAFVDEIDGEVAFAAGTLTVALGGSFLGSCFIQNKDFYTAQNVAVLQEKSPMSIYTKLFIATLIRNECKVKYLAFGRELNSHIKKDFSIKLPVKTTEKGLYIDKSKTFSEEGYMPDWKFIDDFLKSIPFSDKLVSNYNKND
ncbi:restriction endonuclease subunit S [Flavobacterium pallidum]|nr:restriction endonuclease subunit S [Flavobacterium pallidum]